jgi:hypothetical protein
VITPVLPEVSTIMHTYNNLIIRPEQLRMESQKQIKGEGTADRLLI